MKTTKKILVIDDHHLFADGLAMILESSASGVKVDTSDNPEAVLTDVYHLCAFDLVFIDLHMPNFSGFSFLSALKSQSISVCVAVVSGSDKRVDIERALMMGAQGYIPKDSQREEFINAAQRLLNGERYLPLDWDGKIDWPHKYEGDTAIKPEALTPRQIEVLRLMRDGLRNKQIA